jgi:hypothetical protein
VRFGSARLSQLTEQQQALYRRILTAFACASPPSVDDLCDLASELSLPLEETLHRLADLDLVHRDQASGEVVVAYPFSARLRGHSVVIGGTHRVEAMCAIDALGIAPMLGLPIEITSGDPLTTRAIQVRLAPGRGDRWEPAAAVVLAGSTSGEGPSFSGRCNVLNFFESSESAATYLARHPELAGVPITIPDAIEAGRILFADLLKEP